MYSMVIRNIRKTMGTLSKRGKTTTQIMKSSTSLKISRARFSPSKTRKKCKDSTGNSGNKPKKQKDKPNTEK